jgi:hypothetical protein
MLQIAFILKNEKERTSAALEISKPVDVRRLSACALVAGRRVLRVLEGNSLAISTAFSVHARDSGIWDTHRLCTLNNGL